jgi:hypothetical protein
MEEKLTPVSLDSDELNTVKNAINLYVKDLSHTKGAWSAIDSFIVDLVGGRICEAERISSVLENNPVIEDSPTLELLLEAFATYIEVAEDQSKEDQQAPRLIGAQSSSKWVASRIAKRIGVITALREKLNTANATNRDRS